MNLLALKLGKRPIWTAIGTLAMLLLCAVYLFPFYILIVNTLKTAQEAGFNPIAWPSGLYLDNYVRALEKMNFFVSFRNSLTITVLSLIGIVLMGAMSAYPVARIKHISTKLIMVYFLIGFMVPIQTALVPLFLVMQNLDLVNSVFGLVLVYSANCIFAFFLYQGFIRSVPMELEEAAYMDGCTPWRSFWVIVFPLLKPITTTIIIFETMWIWNDFTMPYLFLHSQSKITLVLEIYKGVGEFANDWSIMLTIMTIVLIPAVIFYLLLQKHIISGLTSGALKG
ncbi:carbohydrate ABC transporter permease [Paenibacillaceae bacterium WGS1546]|uniref:carbohydrate ABC transporter permease n=1 Tax=Cohnella sp. WGS1546 TaxID=3366810 RepID=UPI00372D16F5